MKKISQVLAAEIAISIMLSACGPTIPVPVPTVTQSQQPENIQIVSTGQESDILNTEIPISNTETEIEYTFVPIDELIETYRQNAMRAESTYRGAYIETTGRLGEIDAETGNFTVRTFSDDTHTTISAVRCMLTDDSQKERLLQIDIGDTITVRGEVVDVGSWWYYKISLTSIIIDNAGITNLYEPSYNELTSATFSVTNQDVDPTEFMGDYTDVEDEMGGLTIEWEDFLLTVSCFAYRNTWFDSICMDTSYQSGDTLQFMAESFYTDELYDVKLLYIPGNNSQYGRDTIILTGILDEPLVYLRDADSPRFESYLSDPTG